MYDRITLLCRSASEAPAQTARLAYDFGKSWRPWVTNQASPPLEHDEEGEETFNWPANLAGKDLVHKFGELDEHVTEHPASLHQVWKTLGNTLENWNFPVTPVSRTPGPGEFPQTPDPTPALSIQSPAPTRPTRLSTEEYWWAQQRPDQQERLEADYAREAGDSASPRTLYQWYHELRDKRFKDPLRD